LKRTSDLGLFKPSTDVLLTGHAWAPGGKPVEELGVTISVAGRSKHIKVIGDRTWKSGLLTLRATAPEPFVKMPLIYERAFGGMHELEPGGRVLAESRNPVGRGFIGQRSSRELEGMPLPNLEPPAIPYLKYGDRCIPACFAPIAPSWAPRRERAGTYDERWRKHRAPYLPADFDPLFFNTAPMELMAPGHLRGGEPIEAINVSQEGLLRFTIPVCQLDARAYIAGQRQLLHPVLQTVHLEPDAKRLSLVWSAFASCDKKVLRVQQVVLQLAQFELSGSA
jgi:hypothetical protein